MRRCLISKRPLLLQPPALSCYLFHRPYRTVTLKRPRRLKTRRPFPSNNEIADVLEGIRNDLSLDNASPPENSSVRGDKRQDDSPSFIWNELPLSPSMHPRLIKARERYRTPKMLPSKEPSEFQVSLQRNPYALALSTPIRACNLTNVRLPSHFLIGFDLAFHPKTGAPWQLPRNLTRGPKEMLCSFDCQTADAPPPSTDPPKPAIPSSYFLARYPAITDITRMRKRTYAQVIPLRWKDKLPYDPKDIVWREDMPRFILDLLRKKVVRKLVYISKRKMDSQREAVYIGPCNSYDEINATRQVTAALWLGRSPPEAPGDSETQSPNPVKQDSSAQESEPASPPPYAMLNYRDSMVPLYNLPQLLGEEYMQYLRKQGSDFASELAAIKGKRATVEVQMWLWKLMGYSVVGPGEEKPKGKRGVENQALKSGLDGSEEKAEGEIGAEEEGEEDEEAEEDVGNKGRQGAESGPSISYFVTNTTGQRQEGSNIRYFVTKSSTKQEAEGVIGIESAQAVENAPANH